MSCICIMYVCVVACVYVYVERQKRREDANNLHETEFVA